MSGESLSNLSIGHAHNAKTIGLVKEKSGRRGSQGEDAWSIKFDNVHIQLRIIIKLPVNPNITLYILSIRGFRSPSKASSLIKPKSKAHGFYEVLNPLLTSCGLLGSPKISP